MALICFAGVAAAQGDAYLQKADQLYEQADYFGAAQCYSTWLDGAGSGRNGGLHASPFTVSQRKRKQPVTKTATRSRAEGMWKLAESYRHIRNYEKMEQWYAQLYTDHLEQYPEAAYWYAFALRANGKLDEAATVLHQYLQGKVIPLQREEAHRELNNIAFARAQMQRKSPGYEVNRIAGSNGYAASLNGGQLFYTAADTIGKGPHYNQLYKAGYQDGIISGAGKIGEVEVKDKHAGMSTLTPDGQVLYFTQWETVGGVTRSVIACSHLINDQWSAPVVLENNINHTGANTRDPFVTADGKYLLFSSDRSGGAGGYDLWCIALPATNTKAWNLKTVNTPGDEQAPYYNVAAGQLVFSSNGLPGMGGFDLYQSAGLLEQLAPAVNIGFPVNSVRDDLYYAEGRDEKNALLSSDRAIDCCLELYTVRRLSAPWLVKGQVTDCNTGEGITNAQLQVKDSVKGHVLMNMTTASGGMYITVVENPAWLQFTASKEGYEKGASTMFVGRRTDMDTLMLMPVCLSRTVVPVADPGHEVAAAWPVIYFAFDKATLSREAKISLDSIADRLQKEPSIAIDIKGYTDNSGTEKYNLRLSERRAKACVAYLEKKGIAVSRLRTEGLGKCCPVADESMSPKAAEQNRRVVVEGR